MLLMFAWSRLITGGREMWIPSFDWTHIKEQQTGSDLTQSFSKRSPEVLSEMGTRLQNGFQCGFLISVRSLKRALSSGCASGARASDASAIHCVSISAIAKSSDRPLRST